jgi:hypothetical protein
MCEFVLTKIRIIVGAETNSSTFNEILLNNSRLYYIMNKGCEISQPVKQS